MAGLLDEHTQRQILQVVRSRLGGLTDDPDERKLCADWFNNPLKFAISVGSQPTKAHVLVHLDKSKWYGPGNVKWGTRKQAAALRRDSVKLRPYYEARNIPPPPPPGRKPGPVGAEYEGRTISEWARDTGLPAHRIRAYASRGLPMADVLAAVASKAIRGKSTDPFGGALPPGRPAIHYEGRSLEEWASLAGVSLYYIRKHYSPDMPMAEVVRRARLDKASRRNRRS